MRKIHCDHVGENITVEFFDYKNEPQLKDFYKIFKKASGTLVLEYIKNQDEIIVKTNNETNSVGIRWDATSGCTIFSKKDDQKTLIGIVYGMLCYRYANYGKHASILAEILDSPDTDPIKKHEIEITKNNVEDEDAIKDIEELVSTYKTASDST